MAWIETGFWEYVDKDGPVPTERPELGQCWQWRGWAHEKGYGRFNDGGHVIIAHRYAYVLAKGPIPDGFEIDHLCRNHGCVNPAHLEAVTPEENSRREVKLFSLIGWPRSHLPRVSHCVHGHEYTEANTYHRPQGKRECRVCRAAKPHVKLQSVILEVA